MLSARCRVIGAPYHFQREYLPDTDDVTIFTFLSIGKRVIPKVIIYSPQVVNDAIVYNLGFGDWYFDRSSESFSLNDKNVSDNGDVVTILYTVVATLKYFFHLNPTATVLIAGSDVRRTQIYLRLILRHQHEMQGIWKIRGFRNGHYEQVLEPEISFHHFIISKTD